MLVDPPFVRNFKNLPNFYKFVNAGARKLILVLIVVNS